MRRKLILASLLLSIFNFECKKDTSTSSRIDVSNIITTGNNGELLTGTADPTDWTLDNNWIPDEFALFQAPTSLQLATAEKAIVSIQPAFPNPCKESINFKFNISKLTFLEVVITDNMLSVKDRWFVSNAMKNSNVFTFHFDSTKYSNNTNYRIYYGFYSLADGMYYNGHGDFKIKR